MSGINGRESAERFVECVQGPPDCGLSTNRTLQVMCCGRPGAVGS